MWICDSCQTYNQDDSLRCISCGTDRPVIQQNTSSQKPKIQVVFEQASETLPESRLPSEILYAQDADDNISPDQKPLCTPEEILADLETENRKRAQLKKHTGIQFTLLLINATLLLIQAAILIWLFR